MSPMKSAIVQYDFGDTVQNLVSYEVGEGVIPGSAASHPLITKMANGRHVNK